MIGNCWAANSWAADSWITNSWISGVIALANSFLRPGTKIWW